MNLFVTTESVKIGQPGEAGQRLKEIQIVSYDSTFHTLYIVLGKNKKRGCVDSHIIQVFKTHALLLEERYDEG